MSEQPTEDQIAAKYREALERIATFDCHPHVECDPAAVAESETCEDCAKARRMQWPPSGFCDRHYGSVLLDREKRQHHKELCVKYEMKDIAREALRHE